MAAATASTAAYTAAAKAAAAATAAAAASTSIACAADLPAQWKAPQLLACGCLGALVPLLPVAVWQGCEHCRPQRLHCRPHALDVEGYGLQAPVDHTGGDPALFGRGGHVGVDVRVGV